MRDTAGQDTLLEAPQGWRHDRRVQYGAGGDRAAARARRDRLDAEGLVLVRRDRRTWTSVRIATVDARPVPERRRGAGHGRRRRQPDAVRAGRRHRDATPQRRRHACTRATSSRRSTARRCATNTTASAPRYDSLVVDLRRQEIDVRRKILQSQQSSDMAGVAIRAAEREFARAQQGWDQRVISERDYQRARDELEEAKLTHHHAVRNGGPREGRPPIRTADAPPAARPPEVRRRRPRTPRRRTVASSRPSTASSAIWPWRRRPPCSRTRRCMTVVDLSAVRDRIQGRRKLCRRRSASACPPRSPMPARSIPAKSRRCRRKCARAR